MEQKNIFFEEWMRSLREQYKHVARRNDRVTLPSLTAVMLEVGFREDELTQLRVEATMRVDDVGEDYVPDMDILRSPPARQSETRTVPAAESEADEEETPLPSIEEEEALAPEVQHEAEPPEEALPMTFEEELAADNAPDDDSGEPDAVVEDRNDDAEEDLEDDSPQQISMF